MIEESWRNLRDALANKAPEFDGFLPPADTAEIASTAAHFGIDPSSQLLDWWALTSGTTKGFIDHYRLIGPAESIEATVWRRTTCLIPEDLLPAFGWDNSWVVFAQSREPLVIAAGRGGDDLVWFADLEGNVPMPGSIALVLDVWAEAVRSGAWFYDPEHDTWEKTPQVEPPGLDTVIWKDRLLN